MLRLKRNIYNRGLDRLYLCSLLINKKEGKRLVQQTFKPVTDRQVFHDMFFNFIRSSSL